MHLIKMFLENQPPSDDNAEVEYIAWKSKQYHLIGGNLFRRAPMAWWWSAYHGKRESNCSTTSTMAYADVIHQSSLSLTKHSNMNSIGLQLWMTRWKLSPSAGIVSSSRSRLQIISTLFGPSISPDHAQSGESTSWMCYLGHREELGSSLLQSTCSPSGWR
jgi:hypothetical protein